jgi:hypothetical protein
MRHRELRSRRGRKSKGQPIVTEKQIEIPMDDLIKMTNGSSY